MANLIEQMNILKGLPDEALEAELGAPSGSAPPFLIATEVQRRKGMRERYAAEQARRQPQTTVVDDLMSGAPAAPPTALPSMGDLSSPQRTFATGGIVDAFDTSSLLKRYNDRLEGLSGREDRARALALLAAGAGIMGGGSSNTLRNVGTGISAAVPMYQDQLQSIDTEELNLLRGIADVGGMEQQQALERMNMDFRERQLAQERDLATQRLDHDKTPASVLEFEAYQKMTPEEKTAYRELNPAYNPNSLTNDLRIADAVTKIYDDAQKLFPIQSYDTTEEAAEKQRRARIEAYARIRAAYGEVVAQDWALRIGLNPGDIALGGATSSAVVEEKDPLGLGL